jgi:hypothetical protein
MESTMRKMILTGAAALALVSLPTFAQEADADVTVTLTAEQQAVYDAWTAEERAAFDLWPAQHRTYFWTLPPDRQHAYRYLTEDQRMQIDAMNLTQRDAAWKSIDAQIAAGANNSDTSVAARTGGTVPAPAQSANAAPTVVTRNIPGNLTPPPASAMNKTYPVCRGNVRDNCQNPGEGGAPGKSRALSYWPGKPASES